MGVQQARNINQQPRLDVGKPLGDRKAGPALEVRTGFDLEKYLRASGATRPEAFDWSDCGPRLDNEALFASAT
jgi:hypothetical protein